MQTIYTLNTDELNDDFIVSIKTLFPHKTVEIAVHESVADESADLLKSIGQPKFSRFPGRLKITRDELNDRRPEYLKMEVDEIVMPSRDERYER